MLKRIRYWLHTLTRTLEIRKFRGKMLRKFLIMNTEMSLWKPYLL